MFLISALKKDTLSTGSISSRSIAKIFFLGHVFEAYSDQPPGEDPISRIDVTFLKRSTF